jgi:hypothetical protein
VILPVKYRAVKAEIRDLNVYNSVAENSQIYAQTKEIPAAKEIVSFAKQFRFAVGKIQVENELLNEEFLLDMLKKEAEFRGFKAAAERKNSRGFQVTKVLKSLIRISKKV